MKVLISTFSEGDAHKIQKAMRLLPYERLVLVGQNGVDSSKGFETIQRLEAMAGDQVIFEAVETTDFLEMVDRLCEIIRGNGHLDLCVNIAGGNKLLGDAALFAAFRMGVPAQYVGERAVKLPVIIGASAKALLTPMQKTILQRVGRCSSFNDMLASMDVKNRQALERILRELTKMELVVPELRLGAVHFHLTQQGSDILKWIPEEDEEHSADKGIESSQMGG